MQVGSIENEYRVFNMEIIAGDPDLELQEGRGALPATREYGNHK